jgi:hypothetical protein
MEQKTSNIQVAVFVNLCHIFQRFRFRNLNTGSAAIGFAASTETGATRFQSSQ